MKTNLCKYCTHKDWPSVYYPCRDCTYAYESKFERRPKINEYDAITGSFRNDDRKSYG